ncbi:MAG: OmpA family protein, partial [Thermosynechococcaceae cyanobacterium]
NIQVVLQGHTDERASDAYNHALALRRGNRVKQFLMSQGIAASRITVRSLGESKLLRPGSDRLDHAYNRRVELLFQDANGIEIEVENQAQDLQIEP